MSNEIKHLPTQIKGKTKGRNITEISVTKRRVRVSPVHRQILQPRLGKGFHNPGGKTNDDSFGIYNIHLLKLTSICKSHEDESLTIQALRKMDQQLSESGVEVHINEGDTLPVVLGRYFEACLKLNRLFNLMIVDNKIETVITESFEGDDSYIVPLSDLLVEAKEHGGRKFQHLVISILHHLSEKHFCFFDEVVLENISLDSFEWLEEDEPEKFSLVRESFKRLTSGVPFKTLRDIGKKENKLSLELLERRISNLEKGTWTEALTEALKVIKSKCKFEDIAHLSNSDGELYPYQYMHFGWSFDELAEQEYYSMQDDYFNNYGLLPFFAYKKVKEVGWGYNLNEERDFFESAKRMMFGFRKITIK